MSLTLQPFLRHRQSRKLKEFCTFDRWRFVMGRRLGHSIPVSGNCLHTVPVGECNHLCISRFDLLCTFGSDLCNDKELIELKIISRFIISLISQNTQEQTTCNALTSCRTNYLKSCLRSLVQTPLLLSASRPESLAWLESVLVRFRQQRDTTGRERSEIWGSFRSQARHTSHVARAVCFHPRLCHGPQMKRYHIAQISGPRKPPWKLYLNCLTLFRLNSRPKKFVVWTSFSQTKTAEFAFQGGHNCHSLTVCDYNGFDLSDIQKGVAMQNNPETCIEVLCTNHCIQTKPV